MQFNRVETEQQALELIRIMPEVVAIDTEYVKGDPRTTRLLSVIVADSERAWAIDPSFLPLLAPTIQARRLVFLQDYNHCDTIILLKNGCDLRETITHNLIDMHHLLDENAEHDLGSRVATVFHDSYKINFWSNYSSYEKAPLDEQLEYACKDAIYTYRLGENDLQSIGANGILELYRHVKSLSKTLLETELTGLPVNVNLMEDTKRDMKKRIDEYLPKLREEFNEYCTIWELKKWQEDIEKRKTDSGKRGVHRPVFSFSSDKQVSWLLYNGMDIKPISKTKKGNPSTDYETLKTLGERNPELRTLVDYKETKAVYSTFVEGMLDRVKNGRIYPHFNVSGTTTGRISHSDPNMGNLPKEGVIRNFFVASPGMGIIGADYAQLEVVVEANLTDDPQLLKIILEGASKHDITAQGLGIDRNSAKTLNFALQYGAGSKKVAKILGISQIAAEDVFHRYWELYSGVKNVKDKISKEVKEKGQVTNLAGRTRRFSKTNNPFELAKQERQAYNFLIQGVAGEACNRAYYRFSNFLGNVEIGRAVFSVHDEIVGECLLDLADTYKYELVKIMERSTQDFNFKYPLKATAYGPFPEWRKT